MIQQNVRPDQAQHLSLISVIIGGIVTVGLTYIIHLLLVRRSEKKRQRQLALLYLTRISTIVAIKKATESTYKEFFEKIRAMDIFKGGQVTGLVLQIICVGLIEGLQNKSKLAESSKLLDIFSGAQLKRALNMLKQLMEVDKYFGFKIDDEILSTLPATVMLQYHFFISRILSIHHTLSDWISAIESKDFSLLDADNLFRQVTHFKKVLEDAENLRSSLIIKANVKSKQAGRILEEQVNYYTKEMVGFEENKKVIGILKELIEKASQDKKAPMAEK